VYGGSSNRCTVQLIEHLSPRSVLKAPIVHSKCGLRVSDSVSGTYAHPRGGSRSWVGREASHGTSVAPSDRSPYEVPQFRQRWFPNHRLNVSFSRRRRSEVRLRLSARKHSRWKWPRKPIGSDDPHPRQKYLGCPSACCPESLSVISPPRPEACVSGAIPRPTSPTGHAPSHLGIW